MRLPWKGAAAQLLLIVAAIAILGSCKLATKQADLEEFVDTGLSMVAMRSCNIVPTDGSILRLPSGQMIDANVVVVNPKNFAINYSISSDRPYADFITAPTVPLVTDATHVSFSFQFQPSAEHSTITYTLGIFVPSINKTYKDETFQVICDSPPNAAACTATEDASLKSILSITTPNFVTDNDLAKAEVHWTRISSVNPGSGVETIDTPASGTIYTFQPSGCLAGYSYSYSVVILDAAGQRSPTATAASLAHAYHLRYYSNYAGGASALDNFPQYVGDSITLANAGAFTRAGYVLASWTTASDGSGASYYPGSSFTMPAAEVALYAQWTNNGIVISFDTGTQTLSFSPSSISIGIGAPVSISCTNGALISGGSNWQWYVDGILQAGMGSPTFSWSSSIPGQYIISCLVTYQGITYSGSIRATVTY
jgi:hypothetical protein